ncbi:MAG: hypothetical protein JWO68_4098, partial [Actinomycetia bacterium]|nr:hypothetical protein [Actinomycetes bacterium]
IRSLRGLGYRIDELGHAGSDPHP